MFKKVGDYIVTFTDITVTAVVIQGCGGGGGGGGQNPGSSDGLISFFAVDASGPHHLAEFPGAPHGDGAGGGQANPDTAFSNGGRYNENGASVVDALSGVKHPGGLGLVDVGDRNAGVLYDGGGGGASSFGKGGNGGSYNYTGGQPGESGAGGGGSYAFKRAGVGFGGGAGCNAKTVSLPVSRTLKYLVHVGAGGKGAGGEALGKGEGGKGGDGGAGVVVIRY